MIAGAKMTNETDNHYKSAANFIATLLHSGTNSHFLHLKSRSYAQHVALGEYYSKIIDLVDAWAEAYQGCYMIIAEYPNTFHVVKDDPVEYMEMLSEYVEKIRKTLPEESQLQQLVDNIAELIDTTAYKLRAFK